MLFCEVCESDGLIIIPISSSSEGFFGRCEKCFLLQNLDLKKPSEIEGIAFEGYAVAQDLEFEKTRRSDVLSQLKKHIEEHNLEMRVFDIGTGAGYFLLDAQKSGFSVSGSELSQTAASFISQNYSIQIPVQNYEDFGFVDCNDSVTMFCVLAHSVNPEILLKSIYQSLKTDGILYFHTPRYCLIDSIAIFLCRISSGKLDRILLRRIGEDHKRIYSKTSLLKLLNKSGFSEIHMTADIGYGLKKEHYFMSMGLPRYISIFLATFLNLFSQFSLLPRNVFTVYAIKS